MAEKSENPINRFIDGVFQPFTPNTPQPKLVRLHMTEAALEKAARRETLHFRAGNLDILVLPPAKRRKH